MLRPLSVNDCRQTAPGRDSLKGNECREYGIHLGRLGSSSNIGLRERQRQSRVVHEVLPKSWWILPLTRLPIEPTQERPRLNSPKGFGVITILNSVSRDDVMSYDDKSLTCVECGTVFVFSAGEQERYAQLGFTNEPKRCSSCRAAKKAMSGGVSRRGQSGGEGGARRALFPAVCAECGKPTQVPFQPRGDRPVYCSDCFSRRK